MQLNPKIKTLFQKLSLIFNNMSPEKKQLVKTIGGLMGVGILLWLIFFAKPRDNVEKITGCAVFILPASTEISIFQWEQFLAIQPNLAKIYTTLLEMTPL